MFACFHLQVCMCIHLYLYQLEFFEMKYLAPIFIENLVNSDDLYSYSTHFEFVCIVVSSMSITSCACGLITSCACGNHIVCVRLFFIHVYIHYRDLLRSRWNEFRSTFGKKMQFEDACANVHWPLEYTHAPGKNPNFQVRLMKYVCRVCLFHYLFLCSFFSPALPLQEIHLILDPIAGKGRS